MAKNSSRRRTTGHVWIVFARFEQDEEQTRFPLYQAESKKEAAWWADGYTMLVNKSIEATTAEEKDMWSHIGAMCMPKRARAAMREWVQARIKKVGGKERSGMHIGYAQVY